ncbi:MAG: conjugal transfer protein TraG, partial [Gammaproteobacteria bacterium]
TSLYLGLPLLWSAMMAWTGLHIGRSLVSATSPLARPAEDAGRQGAQLGKTVMANALKK